MYVHAIQIKKTEVRQSMESRATAIYPPRCTLTITPLPKCEKTLMVTLTLEGVETCSNQRQFCLTSPRLLASPQQVFNPQTPQLDPKSGTICIIIVFVTIAMNCRRDVQSRSSYQ